MPLKKDGDGAIVFECDECGEKLETDAAEFGEANRQRREAGWAARKRGDDDSWEHYCPGCR